MSLNVDKIRSSFEIAKPIAQDVVNHFYDVLFRNFPQVKPLFEKTNMVNQKTALIGSLVFIVDNLDNPEKLVPYLKKMGGRHNDYAVSEQHYEAVGKSLIMTFRYFFGAKWTADLEEQWITAYGVIAETMIQGAREDYQARMNPQPAPAPVAPSPVVPAAVATASATPAPSAQPALAKDPVQSNKFSDFNDELTSLAKTLAQKLILQALEQELDEEFYAQARKRAHGILMQAIRDEAEAMMSAQSAVRKAA